MWCPSATEAIHIDKRCQVLKYFNVMRDSIYKQKSMFAGKPFNGVVFC